MGKLASRIPADIPGDANLLIDIANELFPTDSRPQVAWLPQGNPFDGNKKFTKDEVKQVKHD